MSQPQFTLTVASSADALISPTTDTSTASWASAEEQALFFADIAAADWCIMGRHTHQAADKPDRHRIIFSASVAGWQRPTQLWLDPNDLTPADLADHVRSVRSLRSGLILGGTRVHDWFLAQNAIDRVHLTIEPVRFDGGVPIFTGQAETDPLSVFTSRGFRVTEERDLNAEGTRFCILCPTRAQIPG
ncbi:MAG: dihydrofolate reductase family protein [Paracoccaceae bacterium]